MVEIQNTIKAPKTFPEIWQPIASAPRDGTFVLTKSGPWQPCITHFATYDGRTRWGSSPEGFMTEEEFLRYWHEVSYDPTEWMPLPDDDVADAIETAYRNGFEDGERHAADAVASAQCDAATYKAQLDALIARLKAPVPSPETRAEGITYPDNRPYWKSLAVHYRRLIEKFRDKAQNMADAIEDEGDRRYFGSTNDADDLKDIARALYETQYDTMIDNTERDPYEIIIELRTALDQTKRQLQLATLSNNALRMKIRQEQARSKSRLRRLKDAKEKLKKAFHYQSVRSE